MRQLQEKAKPQPASELFAFSVASALINWTQVGMPWATSGREEHSHKQPFLGASPDPYGIPQILCSSTFPTQLYVQASVWCRSTQWYRNALTEPYCSKGLPKPRGVILHELSTWRRAVHLSPYTNRSYSTVTPPEKARTVFSHMSTQNLT